MTAIMRLNILLHARLLSLVGGLPGDYLARLEEAFIASLAAIEAGAPVVLPDLHNNDLAIILVWKI